MAEKARQRVTGVRAHPMRVPVSKKNPTGSTIRDRHKRRLHGIYLDADEIKSTFKSYNRNDIVYPTKKKLNNFSSADKYDEQIAVWTDYFNKKFDANPPLDPDVVKALIASESGFRADPPENKRAFGITQITPETLRIVQDLDGEAKEFIFHQIRQKDLKNPDIAIPIGIRWLYRKRETAMSKLKRPPSHEEVILEYKGLLKSRSEYQQSALASYRREYGRLKAE